MSEVFEAVADELKAADADEELTSPILSAFPVSGVSISTLGATLGSQTIAASDDTIARIDELQFDLQEGPCWDAVADLAPVLTPDLASSGVPWPRFRDAIRDERVGALFAFPLAIGGLRLGAVDLYRDEPGALSGEQTDDLMSLSAIVSRYILRRALRLVDDDTSGEDRFSRREIHQATGFIIAQIGVSAEDASLLLRGHAFAQNRSVHEIARDVLERRIAFRTRRGLIEAVRS